MDNKYKGMTINERLYVSGFMDEFDNAVKENKIEKVIDILKKVEITEESAINPILKELSLFVPEGFKPYKAAIPASKADEYFEEMKEATKFQLKKERELSSQKVSKYRTEF